LKSWSKRIFLFLIVNALIVGTISVLTTMPEVGIYDSPEVTAGKEKAGGASQFIVVFVL